jgi:hypothetical protein
MQRLYHLHRLGLAWSALSYWSVCWPLHNNCGPPHISSLFWLYVNNFFGIRLFSILQKWCFQRDLDFRILLFRLKCWNVFGACAMNPHDLQPSNFVPSVQITTKLFQFFFPFMYKSVKLKIFSVVQEGKGLHISLCFFKAIYGRSVEWTLIPPPTIQI